MTWKLINKDGEEVVFPYTCKTFRGADVTVIGGRAPQSPHSTGRIYIHNGMEVYPDVCDLKWINVPEKLTMDRDSYIKLYKADLATDGVIGILLNNYGACSLTVCPECHIDDFNHQENCSICQQVDEG